MPWRYVGLAVVMVLLAPKGSAARPGGSATLLVIVNPHNPLSSLSRAQLRRLFLKTTRRWPDGRAVIALNAKPRSATRKLFDRVVLGLDAHESALYWVRQRVRGRGAAPRSLHSPRLIQRIVAQQREAVGYVLRSQLSTPSRVKVLRIDGLAPTDPRYPLRTGSSR